MALKFAGAISSCTSQIVAHTSQSGNEFAYTDSNKVFVPVNMPTAEFEWIQEQISNNKDVKRQIIVFPGLSKGFKEKSSAFSSMTTATKVIFEVNCSDDSGATDVKKLLKDGDNEASGDLPDCVFQRLMVYVHDVNADNVVLCKRIKNENDPRPVIVGDATLAKA